MWITTHVILFVRLLRGGLEATEMTLIKQRLHWFKDLQQHHQFPTWEKQFGLTLKEAGLWRCTGRMPNADIPSEAKAPIALESKHHLASLISPEGELT